VSYKPRVATFLVGILFVAGTAHADDGGASDGGACPLAVDAAALPVWSPPRPGSIGDCTPADLALIHQHAVAADGGSLIVDGGLPFFAGLSGRCQLCVGAGSWQPAVTEYDGTVVRLNPGACYVDADGGSFACGKAVAEAALCAQAACVGPCSLDQTCELNAGSSSCAAQQASVMDGCGPAKTTLDDACANLESQINVVCGGTRPPLPDSGPFSVPPPSDVEGGADWDGDPWAAPYERGCGFSNARCALDSLGWGSPVAGIAALSVFLVRRRRRR
jgi:hypothetical protein